jgi:glycosyltransferase involved in cell wall biosynthesis
VDSTLFSGDSPVQDNRALNVLFAGQLIERKGIYSFTHVLTQWCEDHPDVRVKFTIAGVGPEQTRLESMTTPANLLIEFTGRLDSEALAKAYRDASIYAFPTLGDEWGVVVNEALSAGVPVLTSVFSGAAQELVKERVNGWLFNPFEERSIYEGIDRALTTDNATLNLMSQRARESVVDMTPGTMASRIAAAISALPQPLTSA